MLESWKMFSDGEELRFSFDIELKMKFFSIAFTACD